MGLSQFDFSAPSTELVSGSGLNRLENLAVDLSLEPCVVI